MSGTLTLLSSFSLGAGYHPQASVIDAGGALYGTTSGGGTVFSYAIATATYATLVNFNGSGATSNGALPLAGGDALTLHPDFAQAHATATWQAQGCAPILTNPATPALRRIHTALLAAAATTRMARVLA